MMKRLCYKSPVGLLEITSDGEFITGINFIDTPFEDSIDEVIQMCATQLDQYFAGKRKAFDVPIALSGTNFRIKVWEELKKIPYGETISYGELARRVGNPKAMRAVGGANHNNPISIIVPCHRVIGADGSLTGYGGGMQNKKYLLELEKKNMKK